MAYGLLGTAAAGGDVTALDDLVAPDAVLRWPDQVGRGAGAAMALALSDLAQWPGACWRGEDVFAQATPASASEIGPGHYASARLSCVAPANATAGAAGSARIRAMADIWCSGGQIHDGWVIRDSAASAMAMGSTPRDVARARLRAAGGADRAAPPLTPETDLEGPYAGRGVDNGPAGALADTIGRVMAGEMSAIATDAAPGCEHVMPGARIGLGPAEAISFWAGLRSALPSASFRIDHRLGATAPDRAPRAALRWSLYGRHDGTGRFGPPTGAYLHVLGLTQAECGVGGLIRTWTLICDVSVCLQILAATGET